ncbi:MAG: DNA gyrase subunit A [Rhizobiales bacterium]|nr:DNA gyrase subunit A [Hyphomicrobiales bacterium]
MKKSYLDYAMSVIVSRALPDVRDGLKPVHRRILYTMYENGFTPDKPYKKSARVVGDVMGKYHPHGNLAIYDALVRLAQDFSLRLPLIDGQGNFGSVDGDPPAADRYTECRLAKAAMPMLDDLDKNTVDFSLNYSGEFREPLVLPAKFPNLLVNGSGGIAVGMATNMAPHNLSEVVDATIAVIDNPATSIDDLIDIIPGPDFPTGGIILGRAGIKSAFHTGRGSIVMRSRVHVEEIRKEREALIVTEIPYQVNKVTMIEKIAEMVREKKIEGISDIRDESDRHGMRVVIELKRDTVPDIVLNQLWRFSQLQQSFGVNNVALTGGRPEILNLKDLIQAFISFREDVVTRRVKHLLTKARDRAHILVGLAIAVANIDEVIALIRRSKDAAEAREALMARAWPAKDMAPLIALIADPRHRLGEDGTYRLSDEQARAILELRLQRLTALGRDEIGGELEKLAGEITDYLEILRSRARVQGIIKDELIAIKTEFGTPRRTEIVDNEGEIEDEDLIQREDMVVTVSHAGYIKRVPLAAYRAQRRGGRGRSGMDTREEDFVTKLFVASTHQWLLFFSSAGWVYKLKVWRIPVSSPQARGKPLINMLRLDQGERITTILPMPDNEADWESVDVMFATTGGSVRRNRLADCLPHTQNGKRVMTFEGEERIVDVQLCTDRDDVLLYSKLGQSIRFPVADLRVFGGSGNTGVSTGVRGMRLAADDEVISLGILRHVEATTPEREAYLKMARAVAGETAAGEASSAELNDSGSEGGDEAEIMLSQERYAELGAAEQFILSVSAKGFGKRTSSYEHRITRRGGKGITGMLVSERNGPVVAAFPVEDSDQIMLVTDAGQLIRCPVHDIRKSGRNAQGVTIFKTTEGESVVSVERISEEAEEEEGE